MMRTASKMPQGKNKRKLHSDFMRLTHGRHEPDLNINSSGIYIESNDRLVMVQNIPKLNSRKERDAENIAKSKR